MQITDELLNRFFENKCSGVEVEAIIMYFTENKEVLNRYLGKDEWDGISVEGGLDDGISEKILIELKRSLFKAQTAKYISIRKRKMTWAIAASLMISVSCFILFETVKNAKRNNQISVSVAASAKKDTTPVIAAVKWCTVINKTKSVEKLLLEDGSVVSLFKGSSISYPQPFQRNKREVMLSGDAYFQVAKNKAKPFTVFSGALSTTALGTAFRVTVFDILKKKIQIRLFTGKVIIKSTENLKNWKADILLDPGEEINYTGENTEVVVSKFKDSGRETTAKNKLLAKLDNHNHSDINFNNSPLPEVMKALMSFYNIKITYNSQEIDKMNFTGTVNRSDEAKTILKVITQMHGLSVIETTDGFELIKPN
jgi:ferric-dicitrate binding protein FerR (iron transport regulator)